MSAQRTLAIVKPDAVAKRVVGKILTKIEEGGFTILAVKLAHLSLGEARGFYYVHRQRPFYDSLCSFMTQGPSLLMVLEGDNAISRWRDLMGATDPAKAAASSSAVPPISPIIMIERVSGSSLNMRSTSTKVVPLTGSPPIPTHVDWPMPRPVSWPTTS